MLLLIDAGNTRVKWAVIRRQAAQAGAAALGQWLTSGVAARGDLDSLAQAWRDWQIARIMISNVAGQATGDELERLLLKTTAARPVAVEWFKSVPALGGVRNGYRDPAQLGCDRFAAAIGAHALYPDRTLAVVTCGTATTIDAVTADGCFAGGMILPGLGLMAASLARNTAQLPHLAQQPGAVATFADNTGDAIASGCIAAQAGAIERAMAALRQLRGEVQCILSGGAASAVAPHLSVPFTQVDNLVLIGLQVAATETGCAAHP